MDGFIQKNKMSLMKKTDTLYNALLPLKVVTFDEIVHQASKIIEGSATREYIGLKYVKRMVETGRLEEIRKGLYESYLQELVS